MSVKEGSIWWDGKGNYFRVLAVVDKDDNTWVHYRQDKGMNVPVLECKEYSCYLESFVERFNRCPT